MWVGLVTWETVLLKERIQETVAMSFNAIAESLGKAILHETNIIGQIGGAQR